MTQQSLTMLVYVVALSCLEAPNERFSAAKGLRLMVMINNKNP